MRADRWELSEREREALEEVRRAGYRLRRRLFAGGGICVVCGERGTFAYVAYRGDRPVACRHEEAE